MTAIKRRATRRQVAPLIIEEHPLDYNGYPFITLVQYREEHILTIVDNSDNKTLRAYVLDLCGPENVKEELILSVAIKWFSSSNGKYPISIEFSKEGLAEEASKIMRTYNAEFITRVIGPYPSYPMNETISIRRRRRKSVPVGVQIVNRVLLPKTQTTSEN
jgi:hypothetical protein